MVALTVVGILLRLLAVNESLFGDEWITFDDVRAPTIAGVIRTIAHGSALEQSPPLFFVMAWTTRKLGDPTLWIRLPSMIFGIACIPIMYLLGRRLLGARSGVVAAGFVAVSPFTLFYSTEARPYMTLMCLVALSTLSLVSAVRSGSKRWWIAYGVTTCAALYTHYTSVFVLVAQAVWALVVCRHAARNWIVTHLCIGLAFLPWLPQVAGRNLSALNVTAQPVAQAVGRVLMGHPYISLTKVPGLPWLTVIVAAMIVSGSALAQRSPSARGLVPPRRHLWWLTLVLALAAPVGLALYSSVSYDLFSSRNLITSLPYAAILVGGILTRANSRLSHVAAAVAVLAIGVGGAESLLSANRRPDFRGAAHYIDAAARASDTVMCWEANPPGSYGGALSINFKRPHVCVGPDDPLARARVARGGRLFTVGLVAADSGPSPPVVPSDEFPGGRARVLAQRTYPGFVRVRVLELGSLVGR